ncbi:MAG: murein transglycosylase A [Pseudomonadota bacterium]|nr:murein transglycosylase A [Pseudomonadota bacterium]
MSSSAFSQNPLPPRSSLIALALVAAVAFALLAAAFVFGGASPVFAPRPVADEYGPAEFAFEPASFDGLSGWRADHQAEAVEAFLVSCARMAGQPDEAPANPLEALGERSGAASIAGTVGDWRPACAAAADAMAPLYADAYARDAAARSFFEANFRPLKIVAVRPPKAGAAAQRRKPLREAKGLFTGYYEPRYAASRAPTPDHPAPLLARPDDLVMVDLGRFRPALAGQRIAGRVEDGALVPYPDHKAINEGALGARARPLAYLDPDDLLELQIQGSGRLVFEDGSEMRVGYAGQNGHPYYAVGRALIESGAVAREDMSMQAIRRWLAGAGPEAARRLREKNPSYVFFRPLTVENPALGPLGSEGVQLTPLRSLAVDRRFYPMGAPVWINIEDEDGAPKLRGLFIAQDSGGAISGPIRGDIFFGAGVGAGNRAGGFNERGEMFVLLPASLAGRLLPSS